MSRPEPGYNAPEGYEFIAAPTEGWRVDVGRPCRRMIGHYVYCRKPSVLAINRGRMSKGRGERPSWWAYCGDHTYGHWVENGQVMGWVLRKVES